MQESTDPSAADLSAITLTCRLNCPPPAAWAALTEADRRAAWWGDYVAIEPRPGGTLREVWHDKDGREVTTTGVIGTFDPPRRLSLTWKDADWPVETHVTIAIDADGTGAVLTLTHAGWDRFDDNNGAALRRAHEAGWRSHLDSLKTLLDGDPQR